MRTPSRTILLACFALACLAPKTWAQATVADESLRDAKLHYENGQAHFEHAEYDAAITEFTRANELAPVPLMKFNIAQAYRLKGDCVKALVLYQEYLAGGPPAADRQLVESLVREMEASVARVAEPPRATPPVIPATVLVTEPPRADDKPRANGKKLAGWALLGVGAAALTAGGYYSWQVHAAERDTEEYCGNGCSDDGEELHCYERHAAFG